MSKEYTTEFKLFIVQEALKTKNILLLDLLFIIGITNIKLRELFLI